MNHPESNFRKATLKSTIGILLIGFSAASICWLMVISSENRAQYDCYVWGFNNAVCRHGQTVTNYTGYGRCPEHLVPVTLCEEFPETKKGVSNAMLFIKGELVEIPTSRRDYRTFHLNY